MLDRSTVDREALGLRPAATTTRIGLAWSHVGGATSTDYTVATSTGVYLPPTATSTSTTVTIEYPATSTTFTVTALPDSDTLERDESLLFEFVDPLPSSGPFGVFRGPVATTTVLFRGNPVGFGSRAYRTVEGGAPTEVTLETAYPTQSRSFFDLSWTHLGGATASDYVVASSTEMTSPAPMSILAGATSTSFTVTALADFEAEAGEALLFRFDGLNFGFERGSATTTTVYVVDVEQENVAPTFDEGTSTTLSVAENLAPGSAVGGPVSASDANGDPLTYTLRGRHARRFGINARTGQLRTAQSLDYEYRSNYSLTVMADDDRGGTATIDVTVLVTDVGGEVPHKPGPPRVSGVEGSPTSLAVHWYAPANFGPRAMSYSLRWKEEGSSGWPNTRDSVMGTSETIGSLTEGTWYEVQVRASNSDGDSPWSWSGRARTGEAEKPACDLSMPDVTVHEGETARFTVAIPPPLPRDDVLLWQTRDYEAAARHGDFEYASGLVDLNTGASEVEVAVKTNADDEKEPTEQFQVTMRYDSWNKRPDWREIPSCVANVYIRDGESNALPVFDEGAQTTRTVDENTPAGRPVGKPLAAEDPDGDPLTYALEGPDAAAFAIDAETGQLRTRAALDHETRTSYAVAATVGDGRGGAARIAVTVEVADVDEQPGTPGTPDAPTVTTTADRGCSVDVSWTAPDPGGSEILGYRLSHGEHDGRAGYWSAPKEYPATARSARIERLAQDTEYRAKVQAVNAEGRSDWSPAGTGRTGFDRSPVFRDGARTTRVVAENTPRQGPVGAPVAADDPEGVQPRYSLEGPDAESFRIDVRTGQLKTGALLDLDHESRSSYLVTVKAAASSPCPRPPDIDAGEPVTIEVAVEVGDVEEPPGTPRLNVSAVEGDGTRLRAGWSAAENSGPPAVYDLRHREAGGVGWTDGPGGVAERSATIAGLARDTEYEVQVRARNDEGESAWSASARGTTDSERSVRMDMVAVYEGETAAFTIEVTRAAEAGEDLRLSWRTREIDARAGDDFRPDSASHQLAVGQTEVTGEVETFEDNDDNEGVEAFQIVVTLDSAGETISLARRILIQDGPRPASATPMARVVGDLLTLYYADPLDAGSTPGPKDWVVRAATADGARTLAVTGVSVSGAEVALSLSAPAAAGESVSVSYLPWAMHPLLGLDGVEATPLTELKVRNETPAIAPEAAPDPAPVAGGRAAEELAGPAPLGPWLAALLAERPAASVVRLDLPERGLTDVSPLAAFTGLEVLDLHGNAVVDVWPLGALAKLRRLDLSHNRVEDVSALAGLQGLEVLLLDGNRVTDVLPLALLPRLARLDLSGNRVADALLLAELRSLSRLDLSGNRVGDASPLGDLSRLVWLDLSGNPVSDVAPLGRLTRLRWLWLDAQTPGLGTLAPLAEGPAPARIERRAPTATSH